MKYYLSVDAGGTKIASVLFNEEYQLCGIGYGGGVNTNFETIDNVRRNIEQTITEVLKDTEVKIIEHVYFGGPGPIDMYEEILKQRVEVKACERLSEGGMGMFGGLLSLTGIAAIAGTGSDIFCVENGMYQCGVGGWGGLIDDEGSGFYVGRAGMAAAIKSFDGRGPKSLIEEMIIKRYELRQLWDMVPMIYVPNYRGVLSGLCPIVARAAEMGDAVAIEIMKDAGTRLGEQVVHVKRKHNITDNRKIVVVGSVWKGTTIMFDAFAGVIHAAYPEAEVCWPEYVPVIGGIVYQIYQDGRMDEAMREFIAKEYTDFRYRR